MKTFKTFFTFLAFVSSYNSFSQCITLTCPANISQINDPNECGALVNFSQPTATNPCLRRVLIIWDEINPNTISLQNALINEGFDVTMSATSETNWDGTNPSLSDFDAVIHLNGTTWETGMPLSGQNALIDFVINQGGTYIADEWVAYEIDDALSMSIDMAEIVVLERNSGETGSYTYNTVPAQSGHPLLNNIPAAFTLPIGGTNMGFVRNYASNPATVLMTFVHGDAVAVRNFPSGGVAVGFAHAGNWELSSILSDINVQQLYINAVANSAALPLGYTATQTAGLPSGSLFPVGTTTQTFEIQDQFGNVVSCSFEIEILDSTAPSIDAPNAISISADQNSCHATNVILGNPTTSDNCAVEVISNDAPLAFPIGTTTVTWTVSDAAGNTSTAEQTVIVTDNEAPEISGCPSNIIVNANENNCSASVNWDLPIAVDNCTSVLTETFTHTPGQIFDFGLTEVTYNYADEYGNSASCSFFIEVTTDISATSTATNIISGNDGAIDIIVSGGQAPFSYSWTGPGFTSNDEDLTGLTTPGSYNVVITDANGCEFDLTIEIESFVNIQEHLISTVSLYPNPNDGQFNLDFGNMQEEVIIQITDNLGRTILSEKLNNLDKTQISVNGAYGIYNVIIELDGLKTVKKVSIN